MTEAETILIQSDQLYLHPFNPRQVTDDADTEAMADTIEACGLLQNLAGYEDPERKGIGIVAGGRRMRGLQRLVERDGGDPIEVPVRITKDPAIARAWAGAENASQKPPHPADEIRAYSAMAEQGNKVPTIARAFAVTEAHVQRRLKLGSLPAEALDALRQDQITLDAAKALTVCDDNSAALDVLEHIKGKDTPAHEIKRMLSPDAIASTDRRAVFVGLEAYRAEGGSLTADLFVEGARLHNEELLNKLFRAKLDLEAERISEEGWATVTQIHDESYLSYRYHDKLEQMRGPRIELPEADEQELDELRSLGWERDTDQDARFKELSDRTRGDLSEEQIAKGTTFVLVDQKGRLEVSRGWAKPERQSSRGETGSKDKSKPRMPDNCREDLQRIKTLALQTAIINKPELLLDVLAWQIESGAPSYWAPIKATFTQPNIEPERPSGCHVDKRLKDVETNNVNAKFSLEGLEEFQSKGKKHRNSILAAGLARAVEGPSFGISKFLLDIVEIDIRKSWTPDAENFFGRIRADLLPDIWADLLDLDADDERIGEFSKLKRAEKAKELEALFADASVQEAHGLSREQIARIDAWLPEELTD